MESVDPLPARLVTADNSATPVLAAIRSELVEYRNAAGMRISAYLDSTTNQSSTRFAVMVPKYGETKKNNLQLAYELVANGVTVLRFDLTNHIGESDGAMLEFTLPGAVDDIIASIEYLERRFDAMDITLVATSLSCRCALRVAALTPRLTRIVCLVGVVNLQRTVFDVYKEDIIGSFLAGKRWGVTDILGFNIQAEHFMRTAVDADLHSLAGTARDLDRTRVPVEYFHAENDAWVNHAEVLEVFRNRPNCRLHAIPGAMHELRENPKAAGRVYRTVVGTCLGRMPEDELISAPLQPLLEQNRIERNRLKKIAPDANDERGFWSGYFEKYKILERSAVFQEYLDLIGKMLGPIAPGMTVLDAGCGNGLVGVWLLRHLARRQGSTDGSLPCLYVGVDLTTRGLAEAMERHVAVRERSAPRPHLPPGVFYSVADFDLLGDPAANGNGTLPFAPHTYDVVCCSLVVSYLRHPDRFLAELHRITRPGGTVVISTLKPHCDLSELYRTFVDQQAKQTDLESARNLLRAATIIRLKAEAGHYTFFTEEELGELVTAAGFRVIESRRSFGNQANIVMARK